MSAQAQVIPIESFLAPIEGENPSGESLQYSGLYDEIREARRSEENLDQGEYRHETKAANWGQVIDLASDALASKTKDLQISVWLAEALARTEGFPGIRDGLKLTRLIIETFWDTMYPEIDEGDLEGRANILYWLDRQVGIIIREIPITNSPGGNNYSYYQWEESRDFDIPEKTEGLDYEQSQRINELRTRAVEEKKVTSEQWRSAKNPTRRAFYEQLNINVTECWEEFKALDNAMDKCFGRETPGLGAIKKSMEDLRHLLEALLKEKRLLEPDPVEVSPDAEAGEGAGESSSTGISSGPVRSRAEALKRLAEVADYFRKTEPHSPVAYLVQRAIRWGEMPLDSWLSDVVKDDNVLSAIREILGIKASDG